MNFLFFHSSAPSALASVLRTKCPLCEGWHSLFQLNPAPDKLSLRTSVEINIDLLSILVWPRNVAPPLTDKIIANRQIMHIHGLQKYPTDFGFHSTVGTAITIIQACSLDDLEHLQRIIHPSSQDGKGVRAMFYLRSIPVLCKNRSELVTV